MDGDLLLYGATGYSAGLAIEAMQSMGVRPILAGRDAGRLEALASRLGLEHRVASLADPHGLGTALRGVRAVLHAAGPFVETAAPMVDACLRHGAHYLDLSGEAEVVADIARRHAEARRRGTMLMPAVGFEAVPSDCLAAHVVRRLPRARTLAIATTASPFASRGSLRTLATLGTRSLARRAGCLAALPTAALARDFDFGTGPSQALSCGLVDVVTAWHTTGVPDVTGYLEASPALRAAVAAWRMGSALWGTAPGRAWLGVCAALLPDGPSPEQRCAHRMAIVVEADDGRRRVVSRLTTPEAYTTTALAAAIVAARVVRGDVETGFQTPARVWGPDLALHIPNVVREDVTGA